MNIVEAFLLQAEPKVLHASGPLCSLMLTPRFAASRHVVFLLMARDTGEMVMVAKVPRLLETADSVEREVNNLRAIQALRPQGFDSIPRVLAFERFRGYPILIETALNGRLLSPSVVRRDTDHACRMVIDWLAELHQLVTPTDGWFAHIAEPSLHALEQHLPPEDAALVARLREIVEPLRTAPLPFVVDHGDLSHPNHVMMKTGKIGVVDWELSDVQGMVCYDLFFFLSYIAFSTGHANETGDYLAPFRAAFFGGEAWTARFIRMYLEQVNVPHELLAPLFALTWTRYLSNLLMRLRVDTGAPVEHATLAKLREDRYYVIWRYTVEHIGEFVFA